MRYFKVWLDKNVTGVHATYIVVNVSDDASEKECNKICEDALNILIENELDTGWEEINKEEADDIR
jgi:hypothetical protein